MTWAGLRTPFAPARACHVFVAPLDADQLFIAQPANATDDSSLLPLMWQSSDGGESWQMLGQIAQVDERASVDGLVPVGGQLVAEVQQHRRARPRLAVLRDRGRWQDVAHPADPGNTHWPLRCRDHALRVCHERSRRRRLRPLQRAAVSLD